MQNQFDIKFVKLYEESKGIIDKMNQLILDYKSCYEHIDDYLNLKYVNKNVLKFLDTNIKNCEDLVKKTIKNSQKFVVFGETSAGKSSFINALIFQSNILPTGSASTTKCFIEIKQSLNINEYMIVDDEQKKEGEEGEEEKIYLDKDNFSKLEEITTMENNRKQHVYLFYNFKESDCFANNVIIDTPGTDFDEDYDENILKHCNEADIVILVFNALNHVGRTMTKFCDTFKKDLSKCINLYVVFNYCDVLQSRHDWEKAIEENIRILIKIFPTANRDKMAFISSSERMEVITKNEFVFKDEQSRERNDSFIKLSKQLKNERDRISNVRPYGCLVKILEILERNISLLSEMKIKRSVFLNANIGILCGQQLFKKEIREIVTSYCETLQKETSEINKKKNNNINNVENHIAKTFFIINKYHFQKKLCESEEKTNEQNPIIVKESCIEEKLSESDQEIIEKNPISLKVVENEIKVKIKEKIIDYIERYNGNDKDKLIFVMKNIYFPRIMDKIYLVDSDNVIEKFKGTKEKIEIGTLLGGGLTLGTALATVVAVPVILPLGLATGAIVGVGFGIYFAASVGLGIGGAAGDHFGDKISVLFEKSALKNLLKKYGDELFKNLSNWQQETNKYLDLSERREQIKKEMKKFVINMDSFKEEYSM